MPKLIDPRVKAIAQTSKATTNRALLDAAVRHAILLERFKKTEVAAISSFLDGEVVPELVKLAEKKLGKNPLSYSARQVSETTIATNELLRGAMKVAGQKTGTAMKNLAIEEGRWNSMLLKKNMPVGIDFRTPPPELLRQLIDDRHMGARPLKGWFDKLGDDAADAVSKQIRMGTAMGESVDSIVKRVVGDPTAAGAFTGAMGKVRRDAEATVRTAVNHASAQAREASYAANSDVIKGVRIVATLDERTTEICMGEDGKVYPIGVGPRPPFHFNCRTTTVPVTYSWKELQERATSQGDAQKIGALKDVPEGARASMKGEVPAKLNYGTWLKDQPAAFQDDVLGEARAGLFRDGKVSIDRFTDDTGRRLTMKQLYKALEDEGGFLAPVKTPALPKISSSILAVPIPPAMPPPAPAPVTAANPPPPPSVPQAVKPMPKPAPKAPKPKVSPNVAAPGSLPLVKAKMKALAAKANAGSTGAAQELAYVAEATPQVMADAAKTKKELVAILHADDAKVPHATLPGHVPGYTAPDGSPLPEEILDLIRRAAPETVPASRRFAATSKGEYASAYAKFRAKANGSSELRDIISRWKDGWYSAIREYLVFGKVSDKFNRTKEEIARTINKLIDITGDAPSLDRIVYRGIHVNTPKILDDLIKQDYVTFNSYASATHSLEVANGFAATSGDQVIFAIRSKTGVDIQHIAGLEGEEEVLIRAGTRFKVVDRKSTKRKTGGTKWEISLVEL